MRSDARRTNTLSFKTQAMQQGAESEPVQAYLSELLFLAEFLSKIETHLLASLGSKGKNRNSLACLRNAGFHSGVSYCMGEVDGREESTEGGSGGSGEKGEVTSRAGKEQHTQGQLG